MPACCLQISLTATRHSNIPTPITNVFFSSGRRAVVTNLARRLSVFRVRAFLPFPFPTHICEKKVKHLKQLAKNDIKTPTNTTNVYCFTFRYTFFKGQKSETKSETRRKKENGCFSFRCFSFSSSKSETALIFNELSSKVALFHFFCNFNQIQFGEYFSLRRKIANFASEQQKLLR